MLSLERDMLLEDTHSLEVSLPEILPLSVFVTELIYETGVTINAH